MKLPLSLKLAPAVVAVALLSSCRDDAHVQALQDEIRSLTERQGQVQGELNRIKTQMNSLSAERDQLKQEKAALEADLESARKNLEALQRDFAAYKAQYKISMRERAPGMQLGSLIVDGRTYQNVRVREATEELLAIIHDGGTMKFPWPSLPEQLQRLFGHQSNAVPVMVAVASAGRQSQVDPEKQAMDFDAAMLDLQKQIGEKNRQIKQVYEDMQANGTATTEARARKDEDRLLTLERARRAYEAQLTKLRAELRTLTERQQVVLRSDPRRKR